MKPLHARTYQILTILLSVILAGLIYKFLIGNDTTQAEDGRQAITVTATEAAHIRNGMRTFLSSLQQITQGLAVGDLTQVVTAAQVAGTHNETGTPVTLMAKLPMEFRQLGFTAHGKFDEIAAKAETGEQEGILALLDSTLQQCNNCHQSFTIQVSP